MVKLLVRFFPDSMNSDNLYRDLMTKLVWKLPGYLIYNVFFIKTPDKGLVKLIKPVKIDHSFLQSVSNEFHVIILSLPMQFYKWLSKNFSKPTSENGGIGHFNL